MEVIPHQKMPVAAQHIPFVQIFRLRIKLFIAAEMEKDRLE